MKNEIEYNHVNLEKIRKVADFLIGTCKAVDDALCDQFGEGVTLTDINFMLLQELDSITTECDSCGWWCEPSELNEDQICNDCADDKLH